MGERQDCRADRGGATPCPGNGVREIGPGQIAAAEAPVHEDTRVRGQLHRSSPGGRGDYYDFLELRPGRLALILVDIAGKGISAALLMANLQANVRSQYAVALHDLPRLFNSVNRLFYENSSEGTYATLFFADYSDSSLRSIIWRVIAQNGTHTSLRFLLGRKSCVNVKECMPNGSARNVDLSRSS